MTTSTGHHSDICACCGLPVPTGQPFAWRGFDGDAFCSVECASEYIGFIACELAHARQAFRNRTAAQRQRVLEFNQWAATVSDRSESPF